VSFSYDPTLSDDVSRVRALLNDRDRAAAKLSDEEITATLADVGGSGRAAALRAAALLARTTLYAQAPIVSGVSALGVSVSYKDPTYLQLADQLDRQVMALAAAAGAPYIGGIRRSEKATIEADADRVTPWAQIGLHDHPAGSAGVRA
jgi:hypothetical protein